MGGHHERNRERASLPSRLRTLGERRKLSQRGAGQNPGEKKTVLVHIKRHRAFVIEGKILTVTEKSRKKSLRILMTRGAYTPYARCMATPLGLTHICRYNLYSDCHSSRSKIFPLLATTLPFGLGSAIARPLSHSYSVIDRNYPYP